LIFRPSVLRHYSALLKQNKIGILAGDTIWGISGRLTDETVLRIQHLKKRERNRPFLIVVSHPSMAQSYCKKWEAWQKRVIKQVWPGPITLIFYKRSGIDPNLTGGRETIAIRYPFYAPLNYLLMEVKEPLVSTSLNMSSSLPEKRELKIPETLSENVDFVCTEYGPLYKEESTIMDCTEYPPRIVREGLMKCYPDLKELYESLCMPIID